MFTLRSALMDCNGAAPLITFTAAPEEINSLLGSHHVANFHLKVCVQLLAIIYHPKPLIYDIRRAIPWSGGPPTQRTVVHAI